MVARALARDGRKHHAVTTSPRSDPDPFRSIRRELTGPGAPFETAFEEVLGARMPVFVNRPRHLVEILRSGAGSFPDRCYTAFADRSLTFESMIGPVASLAQGMAGGYRIGKGDRVAVASANRVEYVLAFWAATALGAVTVALNGWWTGPEMSYALDLTKPSLLLGDGPRLQRLAEVGYRGVPMVSFDEDFAELEASSPGAPLPEVPIDEDDPYVMLFTSGTTGRPKGAMLSHRSNIHFALAVQLGAAESAAVARATGGEVAPAVPPVSISAAPMFHVAGLTCTLAVAPMTGSTIVYPPPGRWQEAVHLDLTDRHKATTWSLVPTQLWRLLDWPHLDDYDLTSLRTVAGGSAVWPPELLRRLDERLPWARPGLSLGYGMTETNGLGTSLRAAATHDRPDSIGRPSPTVQVEIRDPETRTPLPEGEVGEIALRGGATFLGYWGDAEATANAVDGDRWYHTGDFGHMRDGFVYLSGRRQDLIVRGGENVYPVEIENRLIEHEGIVEVAVLGVPHPVLGQEVKACVVERRAGALTGSDVQRWCAEALAAFKVPSLVEFLPELPHNASGKVLKHLLVDRTARSDFVQE